MKCCKAAETLRCKKTGTSDTDANKCHVFDQFSQRDWKLWCLSWLFLNDIAQPYRMTRKINQSSKKSFRWSSVVHKIFPELHSKNRNYVFSNRFIIIGAHGDVDYAGRAVSRIFYKLSICDWPVFNYYQKAKEVKTESDRKLRWNKSERTTGLVRSMCFLW